MDNAPAHKTAEFMAFVFNEVRTCFQSMRLKY